MKHPDNDPNEDISELHYTEILQGDAKIFRDKPTTSQKDTEKGKGMNRKIFHPPSALGVSTIGRCVSISQFLLSIWHIEIQSRRANDIKHSAS